ncbi:MAG: O-antigen ligase family protein [Chitinophagaceae bacterium]|nr:O-antigen ligase family protein [Chitinophagaceae bacterium]
MPVALQRYGRHEWQSLLVFLTSIVLSIVWREPWLILLPFAWILGPPVYRFLVTNPIQLWWALFIVLPLSTELNITPQLGTDFPDELLLLLLTGITIVKCIHRPQWFPRAVSTHPLFFILILYLLWVLVSCICAIDPLPAFKYLLAKSWYIIPFVILPQKLLRSKQSIRLMAVCLVTPMLFVVVQTLFRHAFYSFSFESIKYILKPFFRNHVNYSSMLVCLLAIGWAIWKLTPVGDPKRKWVMYALFVGLIGLYFAYSRGAWIALAAGIFAAWAIRKRVMELVVLVAVIGMLISTAWLATDQHYMRFAPDHDRTIFHTDFGEHMAATVNMKDISTAERFYRWIAGARMLAERPVTGFGPGSFYNHYRPYTVRRFETWVSDNPEHSTVHNYFLLTATEQGLIGLGLFCLLYFGMLMHVQRLYHQLQDRFYKTIALTTGIVLVMTGVINFMSDMIETDKIGSLFWLALGMIILLEGKRQSQTFETYPLR